MRRVGLFTVLFFCACNTILSADESYQPKPIPADKAAYSEQQFRREVIEYWEQFPRDYLAVTNDPQEVQAECAQFIKDCGPSVYRFGVTRREETDLLIRCSKLLKRGSKDPLVELLGYWVSSHGAPPVTPQHLRYVAEQADQIEATKYSLMVKAFVMTRAHWLNNSPGTARPGVFKLSEGFQTIAKETLYWIDSDKKDLKRQRWIWVTLVEFFDRLPQKDKESFVELLEKENVGHPWIHAMFVARKNLGSLRLPGLAPGMRSPIVRNTPPVGGAVLDPQQDKNARAAVEAYESALKLAPHFPEPAIELMKLAKQLKLPQSPRYYFDAAVAAQFDYAPAYETYRRLLLADPNLKIEELLDFCRECAATQRFDTIVPLEMLNSLREASDLPKFKEGKESVYARWGIYRELSKLLSQAAESTHYRGQPRSAETAKQAAADQIAVALLAERYERIREFYPQTDEAALDRALTEFPIVGKRAQIIARAMASSTGVPVAAWEEDFAKLTDPNAIADALKDLAQHRAKLGPTDKKGWFDFWEAKLFNAKQLLSEKPLDVKFTADMVEYMTEGEWAAVDERSVRGNSRNDLLIPLPRREEPFEISCDLTINSTSGLTEFYMLFAGNGYAGIDMNRSQTYSYMRGSSGAIKLGYKPDAKKPKTVNIRVRFWPGIYEQDVNGEHIITERVGANVKCDGLVRLKSANKEERERNNVVWSNIRVAPLKTPPPKFDGAARIEFWNKKVKDYALADTYYQRAQAFVDDGKYEEAIPDFERYLKTNPREYFAIENFGECLSKAGKDADAVKLYEEAHKNDTIPSEKSADWIWFIMMCPDPKARNPALAKELSLFLVSQNYEGSPSRHFVHLIQVATDLETKQFELAEKNFVKIKDGYYFSGKYKERFELVKKALAEKKPVSQVTLRP